MGEKNMCVYALSAAGYSAVVTTAPFYSLFWPIETTLRFSHYH